MPQRSHLAGDALLGLLSPIWQLAIALCVLLVISASVVRLARRGPTRMGGALVIIALAVLAVVLLGLLLPG